MKKFNSKKTFLIVSSLISSLLFFPVGVKAADTLPFSGTFCDLFPCGSFGDQSSQGGSQSINTLSNYIKWGLNIVFVLIIIYGIFKVIKGAVTIIRSEGDAGKIQEGANIMKGVIIGIGMIFVGIIGIIIVIAFFGAGGITQVNVNNPGGVNIPLL